MLDRTDVEATEPGGPAIPILALLLSAVFLMSAQWENLVAGVVALAVGAVIYRFQRPPESPRVEPPSPVPADAPPGSVASTSVRSST